MLAMTNMIKSKNMLSIQRQPTKSLLTSWQAKYIRKNVQLPNGSWAVVVFELQGNTWKAVYGEILGQKVEKQEEVLALPAHFETEHITPILSPFFAEVKNLIKDLAFVVSQPTRAPGYEN